MSTLPSTQYFNFYGDTVVRAAFVVALFGWGMGFYGPPVFMHAVLVRTGWSLSLVSAAVTFHFLLGAGVVALLPGIHKRMGIATATWSAPSCSAIVQCHSLLFLRDRRASDPGCRMPVEPAASDGLSRHLTKRKCGRTHVAAVRSQACAMRWQTVGDTSAAAIVDDAHMCGRPRERIRQIDAADATVQVILCLAGSSGPCRGLRQRVPIDALIRGPARLLLPALAGTVLAQPPEFQQQYDDIRRNDAPESVVIDA